MTYNFLTLMFFMLSKPSPQILLPRSRHTLRMPPVCFRYAAACHGIIPCTLPKRWFLCSLIQSEQTVSIAMANIDYSGYIKNMYAICAIAGNENAHLN